MPNLRIITQTRTGCTLLKIFLCWEESKFFCLLDNASLLAYLTILFGYLLKNYLVKMTDPNSKKPEVGRVEQVASDDSLLKSEEIAEALEVSGGAPEDSYIREETFALTEEALAMEEGEPPVEGDEGDLEEVPETSIEGLIDTTIEQIESDALKALERYFKGFETLPAEARTLSGAGELSLKDALFRIPDSFVENLIGTLSSMKNPSTWMINDAGWLVFREMCPDTIDTLRGVKYSDVRRDTKFFVISGSRAGGTVYTSGDAENPKEGTFLISGIATSSEIKKAAALGILDEGSYWTESDANPSVAKVKSFYFEEERTKTSGVFEFLKKLIPSSKARRGEAEREPKKSLVFKNELVSPKITSPERGAVRVVRVKLTG